MIGIILAGHGDSVFTFKDSPLVCQTSKIFWRAGHLMLSRWLIRGAENISTKTWENDKSNEKWKMKIGCL